MVRHIVLWNFLEEAEGGTKAENIEKIANWSKTFLGKIEGLLSIDVRPNYRAGGMDACLYAEFESKEALEYYREHPLHKEMQAFVHKVITERVSHDCEM